MNINNLAKLKLAVEEAMENESRLNEAKPVRYWYPLSLATYGPDEVVEALESMCSFRTSMAEKTLRFERQFAKWQGCTDSLMVNSGSSADLLLCMLLTNPLRPLVEVGSEILIPVVTWPTQIWSAMMAGLKVKLVDVDPETLNIDLDDLERQISPKTKAIFLVHLMGNPCNMDRILEIAKRHKLLILEDCCEAMGSSWDGIKVGNFGIGAAYSFFFSHHITTMEGGMVAVNNFESAEQLKLLRAHGWIRNVDTNRFNLINYPDIDPRYAFVNWGLNVRPTEVQASFGIRQLERADDFSQKRAEIAEKFNNFLNSSTKWLRTPRVDKKATPSWLALPIMVNENAPFTCQELTAFLEGNGIETRPVVTGNIAKHPVAEIFPEFLSRPFPGADKIHKFGFYIGLSPIQTNENVCRLINVFSEFLDRHSELA